MTDVFFSYSSKDRDRVRLVQAALAEQGFDCFWDQEVPPGTDWDTWIRQHLNEAKCAIVFWSKHSVGSDNVRHEATVAKERGKLIPVLLDPLTADQFPMGHYAVQGANLSQWSGDEQDRAWLKLQDQILSKLTPLWMKRQVDRLEAELVAERARRETAERRDRTWRDQIAKEAEVQQELRSERDQVCEELAAVKARLERAEQDKAKPDPRAEEWTRRIASLEQERDRSMQEAIQAGHTIEALESELKAARAEAAELAKRLDAAQAGRVSAEARASELAKTLREQPSKREPSTAKRDAPPATPAGSQQALVTDHAPKSTETPTSSVHGPALTLTTVPERDDDGPPAQAAAAFALLSIPLLIATVPDVSRFDWPNTIITVAVLMVAYAIFHIWRRRALIAGIEVAFYWLGIALAGAAGFTTFLAYAGGAYFGNQIGGLAALVSAFAMARRRKATRSEAETAIYWIGGSIAAALAVWNFMTWNQLSLFGIWPWAEGAFVAGVVTIAPALSIAYRHRAALSDVALALYWFACLVGVAIILPAIVVLFDLPADEVTALAVLVVVALIALASELILIRQRHSPLKKVCVVIYGLGPLATVAVGGLLGLQIFGAFDMGLWGLAAISSGIAGLAIAGYALRPPPARDSASAAVVAAESDDGPGAQTATELTPELQAWPAIQAALFTGLTPIVILGGIVLLRSPTGAIAASVLLWGYATLQLRRRRAAITRIEAAFYWLGIAVTLPAVSAAAFGLLDQRYALNGFLLGTLVGLVSAPIAARRRKGPLGEAEIAVYWAGGALAVAAELWGLFVLMGWAWLGASSEFESGLFVGGGAATLALLFVAFRRRAALDGLAIAIYWFAASAGLLVALPSLFYAVARGDEPRDMLSGLAAAAAIGLAAEAILIRRRRAATGMVEILIYAMGTAVGCALVVGIAAGWLAGPPGGFLAAGAAAVAVIAGAIIYARRQWQAGTLKGRSGEPIAS